MLLTYTLPGKLDGGDIVEVDWKMSAMQREHIAIGQPFRLRIAVPGARHQIVIDVKGRDQP